MRKQISGYEGLYEVSFDGKIISVKRNYILKAGINEHGYHYVILYKEGKGKPFRVNRLVALHFVDNPNNFPEVNHDDGNKNNNCADNLKWTDRSGNTKHAYDTGLNTGTKGKTWVRKKKLNVLPQQEAAS